MLNYKPRKTLNDRQQEFNGTTVRREHGMTRSCDQHMKSDDCQGQPRPKHLHVNVHLRNILAWVRDLKCARQFNSWLLVRNIWPTKNRKHKRKELVSSKRQETGGCFWYPCIWNARDCWSFEMCIFRTRAEERTKLCFWAWCQTNTTMPTSSMPRQTDVDASSDL